MLVFLIYSRSPNKRSTHAGMPHLLVMSELWACVEGNGRGWHAARRDNNVDTSAIGCFSYLAETEPCNGVDEGAADTPVSSRVARGGVCGRWEQGRWKKGTDEEEKIPWTAKYRNLCCG